MMSLSYRSPPRWSLASKNRPTSPTCAHAGQLLPHPHATRHSRGARTWMISSRHLGTSTTPLNDTPPDDSCSSSRQSSFLSSARGVCAPFTATATCGGAKPSNASSNARRVFALEQLAQVFLRPRAEGEHDGAGHAVRVVGSVGAVLWVSSCCGCL